MILYFFQSLTDALKKMRHNNTDQCKTVEAVTKCWNKIISNQINLKVYYSNSWQSILK